MPAEKSHADRGRQSGPPPRWWGMRPAQNLKPATYRCPLCGKHLPALSEHVLIWPERDKTKRRHAHTECVLGARKAGRLPTEDEWRAAQPRPRSLFARLFGKD
ncbi:MAG TPA: hypothetical protein VFK14_00030 [Solirubrobacterales bacterium]|nr:hypothetical protein [Solirubrobacterales bacterium]